MTARAHYFKLICFSLIAGVIVSCGGTEREMVFNSVYNDYSTKGAHCRAITVANNNILVAGKGGVVSFHRIESWYADGLYMEGVEDFRDIHFSEAKVCMLLNSGESSSIWGISPGGVQEEVFDAPGVFLDGLDFWDNQSGIVYGDPVDGYFYLATTSDQGRNWSQFKPENMPKALENEAGFAASGSGIITLGDSTVYFATGMGEKARIFYSYDRGNNWKVKDTPMRSGDSYGIYSMYFWSQNEGVIVGGSYIDSTYKDGICQYTTNFGETWENRSEGLLGYCSSIHGTANADLLVATGRMGTFYSTSKGENWRVLTNEAYYSCHVTETHIALTGKNGKLQVFTYNFADELESKK